MLNLKIFMTSRLPTFDYKVVESINTEDIDWRVNIRSNGYLEMINYKKHVSIVYNDCYFPMYALVDGKKAKLSFLGKIVLRNSFKDKLKAIRKREHDMAVEVMNTDHL